MNAKVIIKCTDFTKEDLVVLLQAFRDCEQEHFKEKKFLIWLDTEPSMKVEEAREILGQVKPPWLSLEVL